MIIVAEEMDLNSDKKQKMIELVDVFNEGKFETEIKPYFNDTMTFLKVIKLYMNIIRLFLQTI